MMKIVIVVPEYNEGTRLNITISNIRRFSKCPIVVVNDGSSNIPKNLTGITLLNHAVNLGKGAAMKTGMEKAWKMGADAVIFVDADGQHNPKFLPEFESALETNDIVFGYRILTKEMPFLRKWGNILAKWIIRSLFGVKRKEFLCGYLGFRKSIYKKIRWTSSRYGVETEIATKVAKNNLSYKEIKIDTIYVDKYKGVSLIDAIKILFKIPLWYFSK
jgi:polyprenyl-phospho-N-acetylgalactosaminyl synthase